MARRIFSIGTLGVAVLLGSTALGRADPAIVYDLGSKFDHSFNEAVYNGAKNYVAKNGGTFAEIEITNETQREQAIRNAAEAGHNPVIAVGFAAEDALATVSGEFPKTHFVLLDDELDKPNVQAINFKAEEGSFLVGMLAALSSKSGTIGFVGGMDVPLIRSYACGYKQGARYVNPKITVVDPTKGGELARSQFERGDDVV